jgi:hypothetical protein
VDNILALNDMMTQGQLASLAAREDVQLKTRIPLHLHERVFEVSVARRAGQKERQLMAPIQVAARSCPAHHAISGYSLCMLNAKGRCRWQSKERDICTFYRGTEAGYTAGRSLVLDDSDSWYFVWR